MLRVDESYVSHRHHFCRKLLPIRRRRLLVMLSLLFLVKVMQSIVGLLAIV